ncbi:hypothetical protein [Planctomicrobium piriforme]|uniref:DUF883 domain-containing protein n=1 Tax=Planctomicrobium piriforme TaxID=1576369 RepID=A0A1I3KW02_9PLAN|nr:hypothetical protein [Planctomicrobium piriforme]SFI76721.1 hypothetical protein SAMN05421753_11262 [Planctomicrobium piriforme]
MIQAKNGHQSVQDVTRKAKAAVGSQLAEARRIEHEVGQWIKQNPIFGISLALALGVGLGLLLKRRA